MRKKPKPPSQKVINAWTTVAQYLKENEIFTISLDIDYDKELTKVKKEIMFAGRKLPVEDTEMYMRYILNSFGNPDLRIVSKNIPLD